MEKDNKILLGLALFILAFLLWTRPKKTEYIQRDFQNGNSIKVEVDDDYDIEDWECTGDCGGHYAGYDWAEEKGIDDPSDCGGNSESFIEGCMSYANEN